MNLAIACTALLGALVFALGANVTRERVAAGDGRAQFPTDPESRLLKAIRAHGNAAEYVPMLAILMLLVQVREPSTAADVVCVVATGARLVHAGALLGCRSLAINTALRSIGAAGTYLAGIALAALAFLTL